MKKKVERSLTKLALNKETIMPLSIDQKLVIQGGNQATKKPPKPPTGGSIVGSGIDCGGR